MNLDKYKKLYQYELVKAYKDDPMVLVSTTNTHVSELIDRIEELEYDTNNDLYDIGEYKKQIELLAKERDELKQKIKSLEAPDIDDLYLRIR